VRRFIGGILAFFIPCNQLVLLRSIQAERIIQLHKFTKKH